MKYSAKIFRCTSTLNGRQVYGEMAGSPTGVRATPHLVAGEELQVGMMTFYYLDTDDVVSDEDWPTADAFLGAVGDFHTCTMEHMDENGENHVSGLHATQTELMKATGEREARRKSQR